MKPPSPAEVGETLRRYVPMDIPALPGRTNHLRAAVVIPLLWRDEIEVVLTVRTTRLRQHAGEVCFPGGRPDPGDTSEEQTALREAHEELGIEDANVLGVLSKMPVFTSDHRITPIVAQIQDVPLQPNPDEVAEVITLSVDEVLRRPALEGLPWQTDQGRMYSPVFHLGPHRMYGATAHSFVELLGVLAPLYGTSVPPYAESPLRWADILPPGFAPADYVPARERGSIRPAAGSEPSDASSGRTGTHPGPWRPLLPRPTRSAAIPDPVEHRSSPA